MCGMSLSLGHLYDAIYVCSNWNTALDKWTNFRQGTFLTFLDKDIEVNLNTSA